MECGERKGAERKVVGLKGTSMFPLTILNGCTLKIGFRKSIPGYTSMFKRSGDTERTVHWFKDTRTKLLT
jgi:hypothetical protein